MSRYNVYCSDGREFLDVHALDAERAKMRVQSWTWGRVPLSEMSAVKAGGAQ